MGSPSSSGTGGAITATAEAAALALAYSHRSAGLSVGLLILAAIALSAQIGDVRGGIRTVQDHDHVVSIELPISWDADISTPTDPDYIPQIDAYGGFIEYDGMTVYLKDPVMAADHRDWTRSEVDGECTDLPCDLRAPAVNTTIAGYPAIQQIIEDTRSGEHSWELITTVRAPSRAILVTAYTDHPTVDIEAQLTRQVATLKVLR